MSDAPGDQLHLPIDIAILRQLTFTTSRPELSESRRDEIVERALARWPARTSPVLELAAHAHGLAQDLDARLEYAEAHLAELVRRDPEGLEPNETQSILLAALVRAEQFDYASFESERGTPMVLRDALTDPEDVATVGAIVGWDALMRLNVSTPDSLLRSWARDAFSLAEEVDSLDIAEYDNTLDIRSHLQRLCGALSWAGQTQWREHIEPADDAFRAATERVATPLVLGPGAEPAEWWRYRAPAGGPERFRGQVARTIDPLRYAAGPDVRARHGALRTISDIWRLADRPDGLRAMTDEELSYWTRFTGRQAKYEAERGYPPSWQNRHSAAEEERQRRSR